MENLVQPAFSEEGFYSWEAPLQGNPELGKKQPWTSCSTGFESSGLKKSCNVFYQWCVEEYGLREPDYLEKDLILPEEAQLKEVTINRSLENRTGQVKERPCEH